MGHPFIRGGSDEMRGFPFDFAQGRLSTSLGMNLANTGTNSRVPHSSRSEGWDEGYLLGLCSLPPFAVRLQRMGHPFIRGGSDEMRGFPFDFAQGRLSTSLGMTLRLDLLPVFSVCHRAALSYSGH
jgi:hypothetical protein